MKSIKPGRGPSMMGGIMGIAVAVFGVIWTVIAASMGGGLFAIFGVVFVIVAIVNTVYNFKNATGKNRYSTFDVTTDEEEPDPLNERYGVNRPYEADTAFRYCPYCGNRVENDHEYCSRCGKKLS